MAWTDRQTRNRQIQKDSSTLQKLKELANSRKCLEDSPTRGLEYVTLTLLQMAGAFFIVGVGLSLGGLLCLVEIATRRIVTSWRRGNETEAEQGQNSPPIDPVVQLGCD